MELKKIISIFLIIILIVTLTGMVLGIFTSLAFWISAIIAAFFAFIVLPRWH